MMCYYIFRSTLQILRPEEVNVNKDRANAFSGILVFVAFVPYVWAILHHRTSPSPVSWGIWASVDTLSLITMKKAAKEKNEPISAGQITGAVAGAWIITVLAILFGKSSMGSVEWITIFIALLGILLWKTTGHALFGLICAQIATLAGGIPTAVDAFRNPAQEDPLAWSIWWLSCVFALIAVKNWREIKDTLQPLVFTIIETTVVVLIVIRPHLP